MPSTPSGGEEVTAAAAKSSVRDPKFNGQFLGLKTGSSTSFVDTSTAGISDDELLRSLEETRIFLEKDRTEHEPDRTRAPPIGGYVTKVTYTQHIAREFNEKCPDGYMFLVNVLAGKDRRDKEKLAK